MARHRGVQIQMRGTPVQNAPGGRGRGGGSCTTTKAVPVGTWPVVLYTGYTKSYPRSHSRCAEDLRLGIRRNNSHTQVGGKRGCDTFASQ